MVHKAPNQWAGGKVPDYVLEYVDWLITPQADRVPSTKAQWAKDHNFSVHTLYQWEKDDRVRWAIRERSDQLNLGPERIQQVMNALYAAASAGDVAAAKLYMAYVQSVEPPRPTSSVMDLSDDDLAAKLAIYGFTKGEPNDNDND